MKAARITLTALTLLAILGQSALCQQVWREQRITGNEAGPSGPVMWGNTVWWVGSRSAPSGYYELRAWDSAAGERVVRQVPRWTTPEAVYDQSLVYHKYATDYTTDLYLWDAANCERTISMAPGYQMNADIFGQTVVYEDHSTGNSRVWIWDPANEWRNSKPAGVKGCNIYRKKTGEENYQLLALATTSPFIDNVTGPAADYTYVARYRGTKTSDLGPESTAATIAARGEVAIAA